MGDQLASIERSLADLTAQVHHLMEGNGSPGHKTLVREVYGDPVTQHVGLKRRIERSEKALSEIQLLLRGVAIFILSDRFGLLDFLAGFLNLR